LAFAAILIRYLRPDNRNYKYRQTGAGVEREEEEEAEECVSRKDQKDLEPKVQLPRACPKLNPPNTSYCGTPLKETIKNHLLSKNIISIITKIDNL